MFQLCTNTPVPDINDLKQNLQEQFDNLASQFEQFTDFIKELGNISIPDLPSLPNPIFSGFSNIPQELSEICDSIKHFQDSTTQFNIFKVFAETIGVAIEDLIPKIPILNISLIDIINGNLSGMYESIKQMIIDSIKIPFIPLNLFESFFNLSKQVVTTVKIVLVNYKNMLIDSLMSAMEQVIDVLELGISLPSLISIPSYEDIVNIILLAFPQYNSIIEILRNINLDVIFSTIKSMIPFPFSFFETFINFYSNIEEEFVNKVNQITDAGSSFNMKTIIDFIEDKLKMLGISFPVFCFEI